MKYSVPTRLSKYTIYIIDAMNRDIVIINNTIDSILGISHNPSRLCNNCNDEAMMDNMDTNPSVNGIDACIFISNPPYFRMQYIKVRMIKIEYKIIHV
mmetsp:Transcript_76161/g.68290  ORF Transcript_76161/g.68290 Transcript_76161/m.68290 type:complete len:98 (+) Transcript_76161:737-1030(+)